MALTSTPVAADLISVLAELPERTQPDLGPWCRPADAEAVRRAIIDRTDDLRKLIDQAVRLIRVAALASVADYTQFLYLDVPALRPRLFKVAIEKARRSGRLASAFLDVDPEGVRLREAAMALSPDAAAVARGYELTYAQMLRPAILIDVLHNTLGYQVVAEVTAGIATRGPVAIAARQVANALRSRFNAWLAPRLESAHRRHQAKVLHAFLSARNGLSPEAIDDEVVFAFWQGRAETWHAQIAASHGETAAAATAEKAARDEGFRVFRSATKGVLRYRQALADAARSHALEHATEANSLPGSDHSLSTVGSSSLETAAVETWLSPLVSLGRPPADQVKWLTDKEYRWLANYLGYRVPNAPVDASDGQANETDAGEEEGNGSIMEGRPYDLALTRTLLRIDTFGPIQSGLTAGLKRRQSVTEALARAISAVDRATYSEAAETYTRTRDQVEAEALAALNILASAGEPMAVLLMEFFGGPGIRKALSDLKGQQSPNIVPFSRAIAPLAHSSGDGDEDEEQSVTELARVGLAIRNLFQRGFSAGGALPELVARSGAARKSVSRAGFKTDEAQTPEVQRALASSVPAVVELIGQLNRLIRRLEVEALRSEAADDGRRFAEVLKLIYAAP